ncbi:hypothetical protein ACTXJN_13240 [Corynebacterium casei]|uniref:hypothetical protein n=1 Tax=Corynebacterium casei TaxID=160386 RepID=UPI003FCF81FC
MTDVNKSVEEEMSAKQAAIDKSANTDEVSEVEPSITLVEISPGVAAVFGEIPDGLDLLGLELLPSTDRDNLASLLGGVGTVGIASAGLLEASSQARGLFRVTDATLKILHGGGEMAAKDGALLGGILKDGKIVAQARFVPVAMNPAVLAGTVAIVVSMVALQKLIGDAAALTRENIQISKSILKSIRNEQWAAIEGLSEAVDSAVTETRQIDAVTESVWEPIAGSLPEIQKQQKLTGREIRGHINAVKKLQGRALRDYLTHNAESILFQVYAQLTVLKTYVQFQALRASIARARSSQDAKEGELFEQISRETPAEFEKTKSEIRLLTNALVRELRIIAELPGRAAMPLSKKKKQVKETQLTCQQLLDAIEPLADFLSPATEHPGKPPVTCGPGGLDLAPYLNIIRWFLEGEETVRAIAFPYSVSSEGFGGGPARIRDIRVDRSWSSLSAEKVGSAVNKLATAKAVAVTDRRIIIADPESLLRRGELGPV